MKISEEIITDALQSKARGFSLFSRDERIDSAPEQSDAFFRKLHQTESHSLTERDMASEKEQPVPIIIE